MTGLAARLRDLRSHPFVRSVTVVVGGTAAAQIITLAFSPLITRLYGPEAFGALGVFMAITAFITPLANMTYAHAIVLPASDAEARALFRLSVLIGLFMTGLSMVAFATFSRPIAQWTGFDAAPELLFLAPIVILLSALGEPLHHWLYRKKRFATISRVAVAGAALSNGVKTLVGLALATAPVLLVLSVLTSALEVFLLWLGARRTLSGGPGREEPDAAGSHPVPLRQVARDFQDFPLFRAPNDWLNVVSNSIPSLMLAALLGPAAAGFYLLARRVVGLPITVVAGAVGAVLLPRIAEASHRSERLRPLLLKATGGLALMGLVPFGIVVLAGPWLFRVVFGAQWGPTGEYARWLSLWFYCAFVAVPSHKVIPILGLQGHFLVYEIVVVFLRLAALAAGALVWKSDMAAIALYALVGAFVNLSQIAWCVVSCDTRLRSTLRPGIAG